MLPLSRGRGAVVWVSGGWASAGSEQHCRALFAACVALGLCQRRGQGGGAAAGHGRRGQVWGLRCAAKHLPGLCHPEAGARTQSLELRRPSPMGRLAAGTRECRFGSFGPFQFHRGFFLFFNKQQFLLFPFMPKGIRKLRLF